MRDQFIKQLFKLAKEDPRVMLLTGDLGFGVLEGFEGSFPEQFLNVGVAEQNMIGLATGMALEGRIVFAYSIGNFGTLRCYEQIRNDACYHEANVNIVCVGTGFSYGSLGISHHATEDISVFRAMPNLTICSPGDFWEAQMCTEALYKKSGTGYLRLDKSSAGNTQRPNETFELGKARLLRKGSEVLLITTGGILNEALEASDLLLSQDVSAAVLHFPTIIPFDSDGLISLVRDFSCVFTVEEHTISGGFGSLVAETLIEAGSVPKRFVRIGLRSGFSSVVGSQQYLRRYYEVDKLAIVDKVRPVLSSEHVYETR